MRSRLSYLARFVIPFATVPLGIALAMSGSLFAQANKHDPLTPDEVEQIREAAIAPIDRVMLYTKFLSERAAKIKDLAARPGSAQRSRKLDDSLQDFTTLLDQLDDNLDVYAERKSDIRKGLKPLTEASRRWLLMLKAIPAEPAYDEACKEAIEAGDDLANQADHLLKEQEAYFAAHKDEKGQERSEPK